MANIYSADKANSIYIDPVSHNNQRCEFRLDNKGSYYLPNFQLLNLGAVTSGPIGYSKINGVKALIKNIYLYDGKTEISSLRDVPLWSGWKSIQNKNSYSNNILVNLDASRVGNNSTYHNKISRVIPAPSATTDALSTGKGMTPLQEMLPFLRAVSVVPQSVMPNLRLVIEWNTNALEVTSADNVGVGVVIEPILRVDVINDESGADMIKEAMAQYSSPVSWEEIEKDEFFLSEGGAAASAEISVNKKINGFNSKSVRNILMVKQLATEAHAFAANAAIGYGNLGSHGWFRGKYNIRINGQPVYPQDGMVGDNERLAQLCDTWGDIVTVPFGNSQAQVSFGVEGDLFETASQGVMGQTDYVGMSVKQKVVDMQIEMKRTTLSNNSVYRPESSPMRMHIFGEVQKSLIVENGDYNIVYV